MRATPSECHVALEIAGPGVDPELVTRRLGVAATRMSDPPVQRSRDTFGCPSYAYWALSTRDHVAGNRLADHLRWLVDDLAVSSSTLQQLAGAGQARIHAYGAPDAWELDPTIDEELRTRLALPFKFVVFVKGDTRVRVDRVEFRGPSNEA